MPSDAFVVPAGLVFRSTERGLEIEHEADIVLHGTLGQRLSSVRSEEGDVSLHLDEVELGEVAAPDGDVRADGSVRAESVVGRTVEVGGNLWVQGAYAGALQVGGDLEADAVTAQDGGVDVAGDASVAGVLSSEGGAVRVGGSLLAREVRCGDGGLEVGGALEAERVEAGGDVAVRGAVRVPEISAAGRVELGGGVEGRSIRGDVVVLSGEAVELGTVQARTAIRVEAARVRADILIAPQVEIATETRGRVTVVESHNELGPSAVKGCLSLEDLAGMIGDVQRFLQERGIEPLEPADAGAEPDAGPVEDEAAEEGPPEDEEEDAVGASPAGGAPAEDEEPDDGANEADEPADAWEDVSVSVDVSVSGDEEAEEEWGRGAEEGATEDAVAETFVEEPPPGAREEEVFEPSAEDLAEEEPGEAEDLADQWAVDGDEAEPAAEEPAAEDGGDGASAGAPEPAAEDEEEPPAADPVHGMLLEAVGRIRECYAGGEVPPAVHRLGELVQAREYEAIRSGITDIWNQLVQFHRDHRLRVHPQVTTTFNTIHAIMRKL